MSCFSGSCKSCSLVLPSLTCVLHVYVYVYIISNISPKSSLFEAHQHLTPCHRDYFCASADWLCFFHNLPEVHTDSAIPPATLFDELVFRCFYHAEQKAQDNAWNRIVVTLNQKVSRPQLHHEDTCSVSSSRI